MSAAAFQAIVSRRCCDASDAVPGNTRRARWRLYVVLLGASELPQFEWPSSRRNTIPTLEERVRALSSLGYRLASESEWTWTEDETPGYHGHPSAVSLLGGALVVPLSGGE
ncbi:DUF6303 family protein [Streptomyces sp. NPDC057540]|uniref:DUF6303 family protein n=1 Tax=Streptomyces sp. NPDC057540 TaxID=3346160 RepID=UPI003675EECF